MPNSKLFYNRRKKLLKNKRLGSYRKTSKSKSPRIPKLRKYESPSHHSDLFTDENRKGTIKGLRFRSKQEAVQSVNTIKSLYKQGKISFAHAKQAGLAMEQRSRFHASKTPEIKKANKVWSKFVKSFKKSS